VNKDWTYDSGVWTKKTTMMANTPAAAAALVAANNHNVTSILATVGLTGLYRAETTKEE
jgi:hypothetical protein